MQLVGTISLPGDKSISHRALLIASICDGHSKLKNIPESEDIKSTIKVLRQCGIRINIEDHTANVFGGTFKSPPNNLDCGNSGTTMRLMAGLLSGLRIKAKLTGDTSLLKRPMNRIIKPLTKMGVSISSEDGLAPLEIYDFNLSPINYSLDIESAQVKCSIIFAALGIENKTSKIKGKINTRDHLEKILNEINSECILVNSSSIIIKGGKRFKPYEYDIPGDISSAAYLIGLASILNGSRLKIENMVLNERRLGFINALITMGANISIDRESTQFGEDVGSITVIGMSKLKACTIEANMIHSMIDEIPILSLICSLSKGLSTIKGLNELRHKESDRLQGIKNILNELGVDTEIENNSLLINGADKLYYTNNISNYHDHRLAMMIYSSQILSGEIASYDKCIDVSFPEFDNIFKKVIINK